MREVHSRYYYGASDSCYGKTGHSLLLDLKLRADLESLEVLREQLCEWLAGRHCLDVICRVLTLDQQAKLLGSHGDAIGIAVKAVVRIKLPALINEIVVIATIISNKLPILE